MKTLIVYLILICPAFIIQCHRDDHIKVRDIDENEYETVLIGKYLWMKENLKTTRYNDGVPVPRVEDQAIWLTLDHDGYCYYKNDKKLADTLGFLYNWFAVSSGKLCPYGWHVPSDEEWQYLEGIVDSRYKTGDPAWKKIGLRGYDAGIKLKSADGWRPGAKGTDDFGFRALPGGERLSRFFAGGSSGFWWTSSEASSSSAYYRNLIYSYEQVARDTHPKRMGFSIRCIKEK